MAERNKALDFIQNDDKIKASSNPPKKLTGLPSEKLQYTVSVDIDGSDKMPQGFHAVAPAGANMVEMGVMAGHGTSTPIRDLPRLYAKYHLPPQFWQKKTGTVYGEGFHYQIHYWYENQGVIPVEEIKLKGMKKNK